VPLRSVALDHRRLVLQQPFLHPKSAAVPDEAAVGANDAMAREHYRQRVLLFAMPTARLAFGLPIRAATDP